MKTIIKSLVTVILGVGLFVVSCSKRQTATFQPLKNPEVAAQLKSFVAEKEAQATAAAKAEGKAIAPQFKPFFSAAEKGDWLTVSNLFQNLAPRTGQTIGLADLIALRGIQWEALKEIWGAFDEFNGGGKYSAAFGNDIIESIPPGSIYFGGTDSGRFIVTALQKSHVDGDPFFTLTQNALADGTYLDYLSSMYGGKIYIPTPEDSQKCFQEYTDDAQQRLKSNNLKPGEDFKMTEGRVQVSGQVAVMEINGLLVKTIFDKNPDRKFYIEESFPLDWMYPNLEPHDLIMKINRQPLPALSDEIVKQDRDYWTKYMTPMIGDWLNPDTSVAEVAAFAEKIYLKKDFNGFKGDPRFIQSDDAQKMYSKLRSSIAGVYVWRMRHATDASEKQRMADAADFAFRQAFALCPYSPEVVFRYIDLLLGQNRGADALLVVETAVKMPLMQGEGGQMREVAKQLERYRKAK